ncbi:cilia- and flagella-associated protein 54 [Heteronotia binoei]|uniref:cilia- and flagella-associated protein 54 n=1 Tax=Heteronotia binoei TaxID=13085 RepID=UPI00292EE9A2|nr:cilia- and flagella-associated protein 54 [Heteronotia binoei]
MAEVPKPRAKSPPRPPPPPAVFYGPVGPGNPVVESFEKDLHACLSFLRRNREVEDAGSKSQELHRRGATTLFNIWNKYKHRFPDWYYKEKLVKVGDQLMEIQEYKLALVQCYGQYLQQINAIDTNMPELDVHQFQSSFFPNGVRDKTAAITFHVLQARNVCMYRIVCSSDMDLLNQESLKTCFTVLSILRLIMQIALPHEHLCWIVYNGTIYMYTMCRHLMTVGRSAKVLEYLLWACVCMESSVPLLAVHYLTWRTTLYAAVCQCYYDCQLGIHGEVFARRGLSKIHELKQMENMSSSSLNVGKKQIFKEVTVKMATMVFKRSAFEPRRKPKGFLRPRLRTNLREAQYLPWPRTITERLLLELFDCNSSHFFAILEALFDRNRRTLSPGPPVPDESEIRDVVSELFFAGMDILSGGVHGISSTDHPGVITASSSSLMELILAGKNTVTAEAALRFMKMAFSYEEWDAFDQTAGLFFTFIKSQDNSLWKKAEAELKLLLIMQSLLSPRKPRHNLCVQENNIKDVFFARGSRRKSIAFQASGKAGETTDDLFRLARTLYSCICKEGLLPDKEMVIDATMFLWQRCKTAIQKILVSGNNYLKAARKYQTSKWVHILYMLNEVIQTINFGDSNAVVMADVVLRLTEVLENTADYTLKSESLSAREKIDTVAISEFCIGGMPSLMQRCPSEQLYLAYECLDRAVSAMTHARSALPAGTLVLDNWCKKLTLNEQNLNEYLENETALKSVIGNNFIMDLHLELILAQHRVAIKLFNLTQDIQYDKSIKLNSPMKDVNSFKHLTEQDVMNKIKKNKLSRALFLMQKAILLLPAELASSSPNQLLEEAFVLIQKAEAQQNALCTSPQQPATSVKSKIPPPPVLLSRSYTSISFKPAPFTSDVKVSWYAIFGCIAQGSIPKVRLNNYTLKNTAELVQADENCVLEVKDLEPNEMYIFAVAAYSSDGKLIGDGIGETTKPILAYPPLSAATARAYLVQCAFQTENYTLSKKAFQPLWDYFVSAPHSPVADAEIVSISSSLTISQYRLIPDTVHHASPNLLYLFLRNIFIISDIHVSDRALFSDSVSFNELKYSRQVARLAECERMLMALDLSNWLNDVPYALQSVVQCYGLIAPLIYHRIHSVPLIQVLIKCLTVLQEMPRSILQRKSAGCYESIEHMVACSSFFTAKVLRSWKEYELAVVIINYGKGLLDSSQPTTQVPTSGEEIDEILEDETPSRRLKSQIAAAEKVNENLEALESTLLRLTKPGQELTGDEDALLLYPVVKNWHTKIVYKEVLKFKKNPRFLEFFVQFLLRAVNEERFSRIIEWADETQDYLKKRNKFLLGVKRGRKPKTFADAKKLMTMDLYKVVGTLTSKKKVKSQKDQFKCGSKHQSTSKTLDAQRKEREEWLRIAFYILTQKLNFFANVFLKRRRFHQVCIEEMPWRAQMNIYLAVVHFLLFKKRIDELYVLESNSLQNLNRYEVIDSEKFSLYSSGTIVVRGTIQEEKKIKNSPVVKAAPSGKLKKKPNTFDPTSPASSHGPSLPASDTTLQSDSLVTDSSSSLLDHSVCLTPESDATMDSTNLTPLSPSVTDTDEASQHNIKLNEKPIPRCQSTTEKRGSTVKERERVLAFADMLDHFSKLFLHLRRAVVIAHRGGHWTLLQNACRSLWNYTQEVQLITTHLQSLHGPFPITRDVFLNAIWLPFYMASDSLLDMIVDLQSSNSIKIIEGEGDFCVPSCVGGIADDEGGFNLSFEKPFDDVNIVDLKGICDLILRTLEILFHLKKWESLAYLALQFNTLTHERYTEVVTPLLVFAQRQLQERMQLLSDSKSPQLDSKPVIFVNCTENKVSCRHFIATKLRVVGKRNARSLDDQFHRTDENQARSLVSVPVDVSDSLKCFRESLEKSKHHSRALKYSRKLLSLLLADTQEHFGRLNTTSKSQINLPGKVGFIMGDEMSYQPEPPDLSEESFTFLSMVQSKSIPWSKLSLVISSYEYTLEALQTNDQQDLRVQALHELGNLHFCAGNKRAAFKCWCQGLDGALKIVNALHHWHELAGLSENATGNLTNRSQVYCEKFIARAGIWGCIQGGVLAAKIAQHILLEDVKLRTKACILSSLLFKSLFRASLPHPMADSDFTQYEIDELIPGINLFVDSYRADVASVVASLSFIMFELHCCKQNLIILPLFSLYQYFVSEVCRNAIKCFEGRILKIKVLTDLGFFSDAFHELCILNFGDKVPWKLPAGYKFVPKLQAYAKFDASLPLLEIVNLQVIEDVFNRPLHSVWTSLCNSRIIDNLTLAKMHFILSLSATINCIPIKVTKAAYCVDSDTLRKGGKTTHAFLKGYIPPTAFSSLRRSPTVSILELEKNKDTLNMAMLKGILLAEAEERISSVLESIQNKYGRVISQCSAADLEIVIEAKLQLADIAQQRLQTAFSAALAFSTIKLLQDADVFKKTSDLPQTREERDEPNEHGICIADSHVLYNVIAREHMNIHLWLRCRLALVTAITAQIRGIETMTENELAECSCLINEVQMEAEAFNDSEILAEITMQAVMMGLQERQPVTNIKRHLQDIIKLLEEKTLISPPAALTLVKSMLLLTDIMKTQTEDESKHISKTNQLDLLILAHRLVIEQLFLLGDSIKQNAEDPTFTTPVLPLKNIYLPHIRLLAKVKMRIGHTLALELSCTAKINQSQWQQALRHTETALELCRTSVQCELDLEAEILFWKGKLERQITVIGNNKSASAVETLLEAIKLSLQNYQNYGLIRRSYLEIAMLYFYLITAKEESSSTGKGKVFKAKATNAHYASFEDFTAMEMYRVQAWIAVRAAAQVSEAILAYQKLIGRKAVKLYQVRQRVQRSIPEFALLDLGSSYKDYLSGGYDVTYKVPSIVSCAHGQEDCDGAESSSYEDMQAKLKITWVHLIRYNTYLNRLLNMSPLLDVPKAGEGLFAKENMLFTSVFDIGTTLRLAEMHSFLKAHLPIYSACCLEDPPKQLHSFEQMYGSIIALAKSTSEAIGMSHKLSAAKVSSSSSCSSQTEGYFDSKATCTSLKELCVQWYLPSVEKSSKGETMVLFVYAYNIKPVKMISIASFHSADVFCGYLWIPLNSVVAVRDKLSNLKQKIEMLMHSTVNSHLTNEARSFVSLESRSTISRVVMDKKTEELVRQCFSEIKSLLSLGPNQQISIIEIPFDITLPAINNLWKLFDPANGCVITAENIFNWIVSLLS